MPRLFFAFEASAGVLDLVEAEIAALRAARAEVKWAPRDHLHVTLRFLGEVPEASVPKLGELLGKACAASRPLDLEARGVGSFPSGRDPRVVWVGVNGVDDPARDELHRLRRLLHEGANGLGCEPDRDDFRGHLTLGRVRGRKNLGSLTDLVRSAREREFGRFRVSEILLIQSRLTPSGSVYTTFERAPLAR